MLLTIFATFTLIVGCGTTDSRAGGELRHGIVKTFVAPCAKINAQVYYLYLKVGVVFILSWTLQNESILATYQTIKRWIQNCPRSPKYSEEFSECDGSFVGVLVCLSEQSLKSEVGLGTSEVLKQSLQVIQIQTRLISTLLSNLWNRDKIMHLVASKILLSSSRCNYDENWTVLDSNQRLFLVGIMC